MRIVIVTHGIVAVPPIAWGAVENVAWNIRQSLRALGHDVIVINELRPAIVVAECNSYQADVVHVHYEGHVKLLRHIEARLKVVTPHNSMTAFEDASLQQFRNNDFLVVALSQVAADKFVAGGISKSRVYVVPNGTDAAKFRFNEECELPSNSIYLAQFTPNKRQAKYYGLSGVHFVGNTNIIPPWPNYLGEWTREKVHSDLTKYANLVLLSNNEMHPCVTGEALACGLGVVVSPAASANLDVTKQFVTVVPKDKMDDLTYVNQQIHWNRITSIRHRAAIREYALKAFSCERQARSLIEVYSRHLN